MEKGRVDDRKHPLLSKADAAAQLRLDDDGDPERAFGARRIREVTVRQALTGFGFGGSRPDAAWSLNPYAGCHHACLYCYVPDTMRAERRRWGRYVLVKRNVPRLLADEVARRDRRTVYLSTGTDAYQPVEADRELTRRLVSVLADTGWPVDILTRSPLVRRDLDHLTEIDHLRVGMTVPTLDDELRQLLEPGTPSIPSRLSALRDLAEAGIDTYANLSPAYPLTGDLDAWDLAEAFVDAGVRWVNTSYWRRRDTIVPVVWDRLRDTRYEDVASFVAQRDRQEALRDELQAAFDRAGLPLHIGFYNPPFEQADLAPTHEQARLDQIPMRVPTAPRARR